MHILFRILASHVLVAALAGATLLAQAQPLREPDYRQVWRLLDEGKRLREAGRPREALTVLEQAVEYSSQSAHILVTLATTLIDLGDRQRARTHLESAIQIISDHLRADKRPDWMETLRIERGRAYALLGDSGRAEADFSAARAYLEAAQRAAASNDQSQLESVQDLVWIQTRLADLLEFTGQGQAASQMRQSTVQAFARAVETRDLKPAERVGAWRGLADMYQRQGDGARARAARLREAEQLRAELDGAPARSWVERDGVLFDLGWTYRELGEPERARDFFRQAMQSPRAPDKPGAQDAAAEALLDMDREEARRLATSAQTAQAHFRQGFELLRAGRPEAAGIRFLAGLALNSTDAMGHFFLAEALLSRDPDMAMHHYRQALEHGAGPEESARARKALAGWHLRAADILTSGEPDWGADRVRAEQLPRLALLQFRVGDPQRAAGTFQRALKLAEKLGAQHVDYADKAFGAIAWTQLAAMDPTAAAATLARIQAPTARFEARARMIRVAYSMGGPQAAASHIAQALDELGRERSPLIRVRGLRLVGQALWDSADHEGARRLLPVMRDAVQANPGPSSDSRDRLDALYRSLTTDEGSSAFDRRSNAQAELATLLLTMGDRAQGMDALAQVSTREALFLASQLALAGHAQAAESLHARHQQDARHPHDARLQRDIEHILRQTRKEIALAYARGGNFAAAWSWTRDITPDNTRADPTRGDYATRIDTMVGIAELQAAQDPAAARTELSTRLRVLDPSRSVDHFDEQLQRARSLALARQGQLAQAQKAWPDRHRGVDLHLALAQGWLGLKVD